MVQNIVYLCIPDGVNTVLGRNTQFSHLTLDGVPLSYRSLTLNGTGSKKIPCWLLNFCPLHAGYS